MSKSAFVMGGNGTLGKAIVSAFKNKKWRVLSMDLKANDMADANIIV